MEKKKIDIFNSKKIIENRQMDNYIYHYTSLETGIEFILGSGIIRLSPITRVNDPLEYKQNIEDFMFISSNTSIEQQLDFELFDNTNNEINKQIELIKVLCFSQDNEKVLLELNEHVNLELGRGYAKSRMWAQYGDNHRGLCLIFDKESLLNEVRNKINNAKLVAKKVKYSNTIKNESDPFVISNNCYENIDWEEILYNKIEDWKDECEFRISIFDVKNSDDLGEYVYISYAESLKAIVVGDKFPKIFEQCLGNNENIQKGRINWKKFGVKVKEI